MPPYSDDGKHSGNLNNKTGSVRYPNKSQNNPPYRRKVNDPDYPRTRSYETSSSYSRTRNISLNHTVKRQRVEETKSPSKTRKVSNVHASTRRSQSYNAGKSNDKERNRNSIQESHVPAPDWMSPRPVIRNSVNKDYRPHSHSKHKIHRVPVRTNARPANASNKTQHTKPEIKKRKIDRKRQLIIRRAVFRLMLISSAIMALIHIISRSNFLALREVEISGISRLTYQEVLQIANLEDYEKLCALTISKESIESALESDSFIESAKVKLKNPWTLSINITERTPLAALEVENQRMVFDRHGELIEIIGPNCTYSGRIIKGVPPGILKMNGRRMYQISATWALPEDICEGLSYEDKAAFLERQFDNLIRLSNFLSGFASQYDSQYEHAGFDSSGRLYVKYRDLPPVIFGTLSQPEDQMKGLMSFLSNPSLADPKKYSHIDLSNMLFPCIYDLKKKDNSKVLPVTLLDKMKTSSDETGKKKSDLETGNDKNGDQFKDDIFSLTGKGGSG